MQASARVQVSPQGKRVAADCPRFSRRPTRRSIGERATLDENKERGSRVAGETSSPDARASLPIIEGRSRLGSDIDPPSSGCRTRDATRLDVAAPAVLVNARADTSQFLPMREMKRRACRSISARTRLPRFSVAPFISGAPTLSR